MHSTPRRPLQWKYYVMYDVILTSGLVRKTGEVREGGAHQRPGRRAHLSVRGGHPGERTVALTSHSVALNIHHVALTEG
eukprot:7592061-Pyramimonas_sp.AAC.1